MEYKFLAHIVDSFPTPLADTIRSKEKTFKVTIHNSNDVQFRFLQVTEYPRSKQFFMKLVPYGCCLVEACLCDEECDCPTPCQHSYDMVCGASADSIVACYKILLEKMHHIYKCVKCRQVAHNKYQFDRQELICPSCLFHEDVYSGKKQFLFNCYVCKEDNINRKHIATLQCAGANNHSADLCEFCFRSNGSKCPMCRT